MDAIHHSVLFLPPIKAQVIALPGFFILLIFLCFTKDNTAFVLISPNNFSDKRQGVVFLYSVFLNFSLCAKNKLIKNTTILKKNSTKSNWTIFS